MPQCIEFDGAGEDSKITLYVVEWPVHSGVNTGDK